MFLAYLKYIWTDHKFHDQRFQGWHSRISLRTCCIMRLKICKMEVGTTSFYRWAQWSLNGCAMHTCISFRIFVFRNSNFMTISIRTLENSKIIVDMVQSVIWNKWKIITRILQFRILKQNFSAKITLRIFRHPSEDNIYKTLARNYTLNEVFNVDVGNRYWINKRRTVYGKQWTFFY